MTTVSSTSSGAERQSETPLRGQTSSATTAGADGLKTPAGVQAVAPGTQEMFLPKSRRFSWFRRLIGAETESEGAVHESSDLQVAQAQTNMTNSPSTSGGRGVAQAAPAPSSVTPKVASADSQASRMPDFMNDMVGGMPLGAAVASGGLLLYGLAGGGNTNSGSSDSRAPVLQSLATSGDGKKIILTYDEALGTTMPAATSFVITVDGVAVALAATTPVARGSDGKTLELSLVSPITGGKVALVSYTAPAAPTAGGLDLTLSIRDAAGNHAASFSAQAVTVVDTTAPVIASGSAYTSAGATVLVLSLSEALLQGMAPPVSAFTVTHDGVLAPVADVRVMGSEVRLTLQNKISNVSGHANLFTVAYTAPVADAGKTNDALQDVTGNDAVSTTTPLVISNHVFDSTAPTLRSASVNAAGQEITLTYSEALDVPSTASADAYTVQSAEGGTYRSVSVSAVRVSGTTVVLTLAEALSSANAGIQVGYVVPASGTAALQDVAGNDVAGFSAFGVANNVDVTGPTVLSSSFKDNVTLVLTCSEDLLSSATAPASAFTVLVADKVNAVTAVKVVGKTLELSLTDAVKSGDVTTWSYAAPATDRNAGNAAVQDVIGNDMVTVSNQPVDTTRATLVSANTGTAGNLLVLNFNETLLSTNLPAGSAFQVLGSQSGLHTVSGLSVSGSTATLTLSAALLHGETVSLSYAAPSSNIASSNAALQDLAGNDVLSLGTPQPLSVGNQVSAALLTKSLAMNGSGQLNQLVLQFDDTLSGTPAATSFAVLASGTAQTVSAVHVNGHTVTLDLATPLVSGTSAVPVTVSYTAPASGALQDSLGHAVVSFSATPVASVRWGTSGADTLIGTAVADYFVLSQGTDVLTGAGGSDVFAGSPNTGASVSTTTIKDFGLKAGTGTWQGSAEADILDLSHLLVGYSSATRSQFLQVSQDSAGKWVLNIDHDGGASFSATESLVFDNITVNSSSNLVVNGVSTSYTLSNVLDQLVADTQLRLV